MNKVSIIIPTFNRGKLISETIDSVINQNSENWELIIVDDGSTDDTISVIEGYIYNEPKIKLLKRKIEPKGANHCRNIGIEKSTGKYLIFLDSDDLLASWCVKERLNYARLNINSGILIFPTLLFEKRVGDLEYMWNSYENSKTDVLNRFLCGDNPWATAGVLWKKDRSTKSYQTRDWHTSQGRARQNPNGARFARGRARKVVIACLAHPRRARSACKARANSQKWSILISPDKT